MSVHVKIVLGKFSFFFPLQLLLMKRGGEIIYSGTLGLHSSDLIEYFEVRNRASGLFIFFCNFVLKSINSAPG